MARRLDITAKTNSLDEGLENCDTPTSSPWIARAPEGKGVLEAPRTITNGQSKMVCHRTLTVA